MHFSLIDRTAWDREEYFQHYFSTVPCTYSMTVTLDITGIRAASRKLYPALLYALTKLVNRHDEFRTAFNRSGELGIYGDITPATRCSTRIRKPSPISGHPFRRITRFFAGRMSRIWRDTAISTA